MLSHFQSAFIYNYITFNKGIFPEILFITYCLLLFEKTRKHKHYVVPGVGMVMQ